MFPPQEGAAAPPEINGRSPSLALSRGVKGSARESVIVAVGTEPFRCAEVKLPGEGDLLLSCDLLFLCVLDIAQLRKKFEEDKQRIALMRAQRKFRPY